MSRSLGENVRRDKIRVVCRVRKMCNKMRDKFISDPPPFFTWVGQFVMQFKVKFHKYVSARPIDSWNRSEGEQFLFQLRPILKVHKQVADWLRQQSGEP